MRAYVVSIDHKHPDIDGRGYIVGVYSSEAKAKESVKEH